MALLVLQDPEWTAKPYVDAFSVELMMRMVNFRLDLLEIVS